MYHPVVIRKYEAADQEALLHLFSLNVPAGFAAIEKADFTSYLENEAEMYWVLEEEGNPIGSGGINLFLSQKMARISWDLLHPQKQNQGLGRRLLHFRMDLLKKMDCIETIQVRTSQMAYRFYQKSGFALMEIQENFWAEGYHLYDMKFFLNR